MNDCSAYFPLPIRPPSLPPSLPLFIRTSVCSEAGMGKRRESVPKWKAKKEEPELEEYCWAMALASAVLMEGGREEGKEGGKEGG